MAWMRGEVGPWRSGSPVERAKHIGPLLQHTSWIYSQLQSAVKGQNPFYPEISRFWKGRVYNYTWSAGYTWGHLSNHGFPFWNRTVFHYGRFEDVCGMLEACIWMHPNSRLISNVGQTCATIDAQNCLIRVWVPWLFFPIIPSLDWMNCCDDPSK